jgi:hypothetical protein
VTGDFGSAVKGKQAIAEQLLVSWLLGLDPPCDGVLAVLAVEETGFIKPAQQKWWLHSVGKVEK